MDDVFPAAPLHSVASAGANQTRLKCLFSWSQTQYPLTGDLRERGYATLKRHRVHIHTLTSSSLFPHSYRLYAPVGSEYSLIAPLCGLYCKLQAVWAKSVTFELVCCEVVWRGEDVGGRKLHMPVYALTSSHLQHMCACVNNLGYYKWSKSTKNRSYMQRNCIGHNGRR